MIEGQQPLTRKTAEHLVSGIAADAEAPIPADDKELCHLSSAVAEAACHGEASQPASQPAAGGDETGFPPVLFSMADCFAGGVIVLLVSGP